MNKDACSRFKKVYRPFNDLGNFNVKKIQKTF